MFYMFVQNNSGGDYIVDWKAGISCYVIIEAPSRLIAVATAELIGLYFLGVLEGQDCECCGDRWGYPYEDEVPRIWGKTLVACDIEDAAGFVHYLNGQIVPVKQQKVE